LKDLLERVKATLHRRLLCREHTYAGDKHDNHSNMFSERKIKKQHGQYAQLSCSCWAAEKKLKLAR